MRTERAVWQGVKSTMNRTTLSLLRLLRRCALALPLLAAAPAVAAPIEDVVHFYHVDPLGSVRAVTGMDGEIVSRHDYLPFGDEIPCNVGGRDQLPGYCG